MIKLALTASKRFVAAEAGATAIEYALIASLLSVAIIGSIVVLNGTLTELFNYVREAIVPALEGA